MTLAIVDGHGNWVTAMSFEDNPEGGDGFESQYDCLGQAEGRLRSLLSLGQWQLVYASRGLVLHLDERTGALSWLMVFEPLAMADFEASWIAKQQTRLFRGSR